MSTTCHIDVGPELNIVHAADLRQQWLAQIRSAHEEVALNLAGVQEMDSAGLQLLVSLSKTLVHDGKQLQLHQPSRVVKEVLDTFGLASHFAIGNQP